MRKTLSQLKVLRSHTDTEKSFLFSVLCKQGKGYQIFIDCHFLPLLETRNCS